ncbi:hypothetical protein IKF84_00655 [Candidatus Saccharibacteria bacterium]|nr:hypothetical protein [Candidatus Saccharibacteria bacterium]
MSEKSPNKNTNSSPNQSKWDDMANFEKQLKAFRETKANKRFEELLEKRDQRLKQNPEYRKRSAKEEEAYLDNLLKKQSTEISPSTKLQPKTVDIPKTEIKLSERNNEIAENKEQQIQTYQIEQKDIKKAQAIEDKSDIPAFLKEQIRYERAIGKSEPRIIEVPESEIRMVTEPEIEAEHNKEIEQGKELLLTQAREFEPTQAQAKELAQVQAKELELVQAKELEDQQNSEDYYRIIQEKIDLEKLENQENLENQEGQKNINDYDNTIQELLELDTAKDIEDYDNIRKELRELDDEIAREEMNSRPLVAINADWTHDKKEMAHDLAEQTLNAETEKGNIITKIWKGTLFKKYYEKKYEKEFLSEKRTDKNGKTLTDLIREESPAVMERFVMGAVEDEAYIHKGAGEELKTLDEETNEKIKHAIEKYARISLKRGEKVSELDRKFENDIDEIFHQKSLDSSNNNYLEVAREAARRYKEVAINAKNKAEHDKAMSLVMAGFQAYHAEVRNNVRTEAHRDNLDKIVNWCESNPIGQFIPAEIVAGAAGAAMALTQTGIKAVFGVAGGIVGSSVISGLKERNRITEDRARMLRDVASGKDYNSKNKKVAKHEERIGGTLYDMQKASSLTDRINAAMDLENGKAIAMNLEDDKVYRKALLSAIAEARVRIDFSDAEKKDLISYSSDHNRGKERLDLDIALIRAEKTLNRREQEILEIMKGNIKDDIYEDVTAKDKKFKNYRALAAMKKAGKSLVLGTTIFLGSQEIMAAIDPSKIGIFEKAGLIKTENANDAKETLLASGFGQFRGSYEVPGASKKIEVNDVSKPDAIKKFEAEGYTKIKTQDAWSEPKSTLTEVDPSASTAKIDVKYDGWASKGGLTTNIENGKFVSTIKGAATINGRSVNYTPEQVKAFITIGDSKFEIAGSINESGQLTWGDNGTFTTTTGETIKAIGDNGEKLYKYFEVAVDNGVENGVHHITPLATDIGSNTFSGKIEQLVETSIEHPAVYSFVKEIPGEPESFVRGVTSNGFAFAPELARTGLGEPTAIEAEEAPVEQETPAEQAPEQPSLREVLNSVPEENIEVMPDAPVEVEPSSETTPEEVTLESPVELPPVEPESETTPESDFNNWENEMFEDIESARDLIGDEGVAAFKESRPINDEMERRWDNWWANLSEESKNAVRDLEDHITNSNRDYSYSPDRKFGIPFKLWLAKNS